MEILAAFIVIYLLGTATPVFVFRALIAGKTGDDSTRILDFAMLGIAIFILLTLYAWYVLRAG